MLRTNTTSLQHNNYKTTYRYRKPSIIGIVMIELHFLAKLQLIGLHPAQRSYLTVICTSFCISKTLFFRYKICIYWTVVNLWQRYHILATQIFYNSEWGKFWKINSCLIINHAPLNMAFASFRIFMPHVQLKAFKTYIQFSEFTQIKSLQ